jgi:hypothetical protein
MMTLFFRSSVGRAFRQAPAAAGPLTATLRGLATTRAPTTPWNCASPLGQAERAKLCELMSAPSKNASTVVKTQAWLTYTEAIEDVGRADNYGRCNILKDEGALTVAGERVHTATLQQIHSQLRNVPVSPAQLSYFRNNFEPYLASFSFLPDANPTVRNHRAFLWLSRELFDRVIKSELKDAKDKGFLEFHELLLEQIDERWGRLTKPRIQPGRSDPVSTMGDFDPLLNGSDFQEVWSLILCDPAFGLRPHPNNERKSQQQGGVGGRETLRLLRLRMLNPAIHLLREDVARGAWKRPKLSPREVGVLSVNVERVLAMLAFFQQDAFRSHSTAPKESTPAELLQSFKASPFASDLQEYQNRIDLDIQEEKAIEAGKREKHRRHVVEASGAPVRGKPGPFKQKLFTFTISVFSIVGPCLGSFYGAPTLGYSFMAFLVVAAWCSLPD